MVTLVTKVTDRGQASIPARVRKQLDLRTGTRLVWEAVSDHEVRVRVQAADRAEGARAMLGFARTFRATKRTATWMKELRAGEPR
jgi:AbrB family looped-hinge helix DNA binding protein